MLDRLYALPEGLILAFTVLAMVGLMAGLPLLVQRLPWMRPSDPHTDFVVRTQSTLFTMTSLVLTFTLVQAGKDPADVDYPPALSGIRDTWQAAGDGAEAAVAQVTLGDLLRTGAPDFQI